MCGIIGIVGTKPVAERLVESLSRLEYRGYDSAGIAAQVAAVVLGHKDLAGRHADPQRHFRGHRKAVGLAANAISPEIGALAHRQLSKRSETQI